MSANKLLAIDSLGEKISNNLQSGKQPLFGVAFPFMWPFCFKVVMHKKVILTYEFNEFVSFPIPEQLSILP
jgi:hypothetical protein